MPGVVGDEQSVEEESFSRGLLDYPHYTRPAEFGGLKVPDVLLSGHHARRAAVAKARRWRGRWSGGRTCWSTAALDDGTGGCSSEIRRSAEATAPRGRATEPADGRRREP